MGVLEVVPQMFLLSIFSEMGVGVPGIEGPYDLALILDDELKRQQGELGAWVVTWGPAVRFLAEYDGEGARPDAVNTVFVAYSPTEQRVAVVIAGTNPYSWFDWLVEDWFISALVPWGGLPVAGAAISAGTSIVLDSIRGLTSLPGLPGSSWTGPPTTLLGHLSALVASIGRAVDVVITGHSLGGTVAPALAVELEQQRGAWDPRSLATLRVVTFAGATTGNAAFAASAEQLLDQRIVRVHNSLDTSTLGWSPTLLARVPTLYSPRIPPNATTELMISYWSAEAEEAVAQADHEKVDGGSYTHVAAAAPALVGTNQDSEISPYSSSYVNFNRQAEFQHVDAYFYLLGIARHVGYATFLNTALAPRRMRSAQTKVVSALAAAGPSLGLRAAAATAR